jgi:hypothetical protein
MKIEHETAAGARWPAASASPLAPVQLRIDSLRLCDYLG